MLIKSLHIKNFRLLKDVVISLEPKATVVVGRNNSGKTSLTEIFRRLLSARSPAFSLYDFNLQCIADFRKALQLKIANAELDVIREALPSIEIALTIEYDPAIPDLGLLGHFIIDLNPACHEAKIVIRYELSDGKIEQLFEGITEDTDTDFSLFTKELRDRMHLFTVHVHAEDPGDPTNTATIDYSIFKQLIGASFINAQRGLDDITHSEKDVLGKVLAKLFKTATGDSAPEDMKQKSEELRIVISDIQSKMDIDFNTKLDGLLPALQLFGYPGLGDPALSSETTIDVADILESHTRIRYSQGNGLYLPETYNGLGSRNLIYILFQLFEFFRDWQSLPVTTSCNLIFIEEPEAHLHPQMQQVFIKQIHEIADVFARTMNGGVPWNVQFIITTHSTHIANEANFDSIRYFLTVQNQQKETKVKDLHAEFKAEEVKVDKEFLHKYLTLTKCDLFFADKTILIEGTSERILMPELIKKTDQLPGESPKLGSQYISVIEIGGAYMHHFYKFLDFLELRTLVITDLDAVMRIEATPEKRVHYAERRVAEGSHSSNAGIKNWFDETLEGYMLLSNCTAKLPEEKIRGSRRIAYQIPEQGRTCCGRSFEDAFMLANLALFGLVGDTDDALAVAAYGKLPGDAGKTEMAMKYAIDELNWVCPLYISEGLQWLANKPNVPAPEVRDAIVNIIEP